MQISQDHIQYLNSEALVVVAAKEEGIIYRIKDGEIERIETLENHPPTYSDDEGFFFSAAGGGAPKEEDDSVYKKELDKKIGAELNHLLKSEAAKTLFIFEPDYLKGRIVEQLHDADTYTVHQVRYGNFIHEPLPKLVEYIARYSSNAHIDLDDHDYTKDFDRTS